MESPSFESKAKPGRSDLLPPVTTGFLLIGPGAPLEPAGAPRPPPLAHDDELELEIDPETGIDLSAIRENLKLTPWERLLANDDTVNFCDLGRAALQNSGAAISRTPREADRG